MRLSHLVAAALGSVALACSGQALAEGAVKHPHAPAEGFSFEKPFGYFDQNQLQRGYKVYKEVCAACHSMKLVSFRNLGQPGGPFHDEAYPNPNDNPYVKAIAAEYEIDSVDSETGDPIKVPAKTSDRFPSPYANEAAARGANGGALPPDLSVIAKARHGGASYIYSLLTGYYEPVPAGLTVASGQHYNPYFPGDTKAAWSHDPRHAPPGGFLAMAKPLVADGQVEFGDGREPTIHNMAADVAAFLAWASEPKQTTRKQLGVAALIYLGVLAILVYASYRRIWRNVEH